MEKFMYSIARIVPNDAGGVDVMDGDVLKAFTHYNANTGDYSAYAESCEYHCCGMLGDTYPTNMNALAAIEQYFKNN